ncbi:hypothetical protein Acr_10g0006530 [Actinidia rufa]|uniref:UDP-Glycosyltransferase superfamily protein n=1 Tax=Actinidia rufa TaxID=165716 RepID=A0A7J0F984_9ERIC|nr:hypothetical protein Acr_10g0006530 [Actinidia rufa]
MVFSVLTAVTKVFWGLPDFLTGEGQKRARSTMESLSSLPLWVTFPLRTAVYGWSHARVRTVAKGSSESELVFKAVEASQAVAIRSCRELKGEYLSSFNKLIGKPVTPAGLLPLEKPQQKEIVDKSWGEIFDWLDKQDPKSVVFVGFRSECKLTKEEIYEIAYGLEASELPFLWALRKRSWAIDDSDALPPGFSQSRLTSNTQVAHLGGPTNGDSLTPFDGGLVVPRWLLVEKGLAIEMESGEEGRLGGAI